MTRETTADFDSSDRSPPNGFLVDTPTLPPRDRFESAAPFVAPTASDGVFPRCGDYELLAEIARGGMGIVYKARQISLNRVVALKMILAEQLASDDDVARFRAEAEAAAGLDHPGIVPVYEVGEDAGRHYFSMGLVDGPSLAGKIAAGPLPPRDAAALVLAVAQAVHFAHQHGVIHRDLKPANVLLGRDGQPRVTDFGVAKRQNAANALTIAAAGQIIGTPGFMPPEQANGKTHAVGPTADIYSLGAILYALLTGRPPFQAASPMETLIQVLEREPVAPRQLNTEVPKDLETICLKCLDKSPERRYPTAQALSDELQRVLDDEPILARPISATARVGRWCRRNPLSASLATALALVLATVSIGSPIVAVYQAMMRSATERMLGETGSQLEEKEGIVAALERTAKTQRRRIDEAARRAEAAEQAVLVHQARWLALLARELLPVHHDVSLLLAAEAGRVSKKINERPLREVEETLRDMLAAVAADSIEPPAGMSLDALVAHARQAAGRDWTREEKAKYLLDTVTPTRPDTALNDD